MNRRELLTSSGVLGITALSGCLDFLRRDDEEDEYPELPSQERVSEPTYDINIPSNESEWNSDYMGENMPSSPTVRFSRVTNASLDDETLSVENMVESNEYHVRIIDNREDLENILSTDNSFSIDFSDEVLIVIESGYGSSSLTHEWKRVEENDGNLHLYGFYMKPFDARLDFSPKSSIIRVEKPDNLELAYVNLTVTEEHQVHFDSDEDIVRIEAMA